MFLIATHYKFSRQTQVQHLMPLIGNIKYALIEVQLKRVNIGYEQKTKNLETQIEQLTSRINELEETVDHAIETLGVAIQFQARVCSDASLVMLDIIDGAPPVDTAITILENRNKQLSDPAIRKALVRAHENAKNDNNDQT